MNDPTNTEFPLNDLVEDFSRNIASRCTRRSLLGRLSRVALGVLGIQLLPVLPFDRRVHAFHSSGDPCTDNWMLCGAQGTLCQYCPNGGQIQCPTGSGCSFLQYGNGTWCACCLNPDTGQGRTICYYDCCVCGTYNSSGCRVACGNGTNCSSHIQAWCAAGT